MHVGRFLKQKNHKGLIEIFELVHREVNGTKLILIGDGPLRPNIEAFAKEKGLQHDVIFLGIRKDVKELLAISDVFVFPSIFEGFGIAAIEANAVGLPVVGSRIPGLIEAVKDGETSLLFSPDDISGMASAIIRLLLDADLNETLGRSGIMWARSNFSLNMCRDSLLRLYHEYAR